jgi:hypothetical protein
LLRFYFGRLTERRQLSYRSEEKNERDFFHSLNSTWLDFIRFLRPLISQANYRR